MHRDFVLVSVALLPQRARIDESTEVRDSNALSDICSCSCAVARGSQLAFSLYLVVIDLYASPGCAYTDSTVVSGVLRVKRHCRTLTLVNRLVVPLAACQRFASE
eukprot:6480659-Amphidinium_carterae.1